MPTLLLLLLWFLQLALRKLVVGLYPIVSMKGWLGPSMISKFLNLPFVSVCLDKIHITYDSWIIL